MKCACHSREGLSQTGLERERKRVRGDLANRIEENLWGGKSLKPIKIYGDRSKRTGTWGEKMMR